MRLEIHACPIIVIGKCTLLVTSSQSSVRWASGFWRCGGHCPALLRAYFLYYRDHCQHHRVSPRTDGGRLYEAALPRGLASFVVCAIALMGLYMAGLGLYTKSQAFIVSLPVYGQRLNELVEGAATRMDRFQTGVYRTLVPRRFQEGAETPPPQPDPAAARRNRKKSEPGAKHQSFRKFASARNPRLF